MTKKRAPAERLAAFITWCDWTRAKAAEEFGCSPAYVSVMVHGQKLPERLIANAIERVTEASAWPGGTIRSEEWDEVELARRTGTAA